MQYGQEVYQKPKNLTEPLLFLDHLAYHNEHKILIFTCFNIKQLRYEIETHSTHNSKKKIRLSLLYLSTIIPVTINLKFQFSKSSNIEQLRYSNEIDSTHNSRTETF